MERLTKREKFELDNGEQIVLCNYDDSNCNDSCLYARPCDWLKKAKQKLWDYENADEKGLLMRLPIAIGSDVYYIPSKVNFGLNVLHHHEEFNRVYHQKIARIHFTENGWYAEGDLNLEYGVVDRIFVDKLYKETWFLTKEEAEQALKQMGE